MLQRIDFRGKFAELQEIAGDSGHSGNLLSAVGSCFKLHFAGAVSISKVWPTDDVVSTYGPQPLPHLCARLQQHHHQLAPKQRHSLALLDGHHHVLPPKHNPPLDSRALCSLRSFALACTYRDNLYLTPYCIVIHRLSTTVFIYTVYYTSNVINNLHDICPQLSSSYLILIVRCRCSD